jgi:uncharacterized membrane-anchored protein YitT (DUF2179 family)
LEFINLKWGRQMKSWWKGIASLLLAPKELALIIVGSALFSASINLLIVPYKLYNPGCTGIAQVIRTVFLNITGLSFSFDIAGVINFLLNIPLYFLAYKSISKKFLLGTVISIIMQTICFSVISVPEIPVINDILASCVIGGIFSAVGIGCTLIAGCSGGGTDILGMYASLKWKNFSVGKLTIIINTAIYLVCAILFDYQTAIYSIIYAGIFSLVLDRVHLQNIQMYCMIFTRKGEVKEKIIRQLVRGLSYWDGIGGYTNTGIEVIVTIISKYEVNQLKKLILEMDPQAFIIIMEGTRVVGNFEKRLVAR